ncbi:uncharacterized protein LOC129290733 [Prosopis cineraria]|uniref:uncharacterized protein LOC129290733 n=1 Tax=Prosopis cineraria TaxID=364024 RepID=UPI0024106883|nr:uncharacterized protein LOC129290733 [Prosopis cineraria]
MIMASSAKPKHISITLVVDKDKNKVLYAEAESDFVDILLSFLSLPLGTVSELISKDSTAQPCRFNCITSLYQSSKNLDPKYFYSNEYKGKLLNPTNPMEAYSEKLVYNLDDTPISQGFHGYLHKPTSFIVSDDLLALVSDLDTTWWMLQNFRIDFDSERLTVNVTQNEVLDLLKFSLWSETLLTDLFLRKKLPIPNSQIPESELEVNEIKGKEGRKMNLRLMVLKSPRKVLFGEAGEDFTDQLLSFLTIPLGALEHLSQGKFGLGCIDNLYKSLRRLDPTRDFSSEFYDLKNKLLNPHVA